MSASGTERTCYLIGTVIFIFALGAMLIAFDAFMPKSYFDWMQRHRWGREGGRDAYAGDRLGDWLGRLLVDPLTPQPEAFPVITLTTSGRRHYSLSPSFSD